MAEEEFDHYVFIRRPDGRRLIVTVAPRGMPWWLARGGEESFIFAAVLVGALKARWGWVVRVTAGSLLFRRRHLLVHRRTTLAEAKEEAKRLMAELRTTNDDRIFDQSIGERQA